MRRYALVVICCAATAACAKRDNAAATDTTADTVAAAAAPAPAPAATSLADQAGTWSGRTMPMDKDTVVATWTVVRTADTTGWTLTFPKGKPIPMRVLSARSDSEVVEFGPYENPDQRGQMQTVRAVSHLEGEKRVGTFELRYASKPDSVAHGRFEMTRTP